MGLVIKRDGYRSLLFDLCKSPRVKMWGAAMVLLNAVVAYFAAHHKLCYYFFSMQFSYEHTAQICHDGAHRVAPRRATPHSARIVGRD